MPLPSERAVPQVDDAEAEVVPEDLDEWLARLRLRQYAVPARDWCVRMGAAGVSEVLENLKEFAEFLALKPLERLRIEKEKKKVDDAKQQPPTPPANLSPPLARPQDEGTGASALSRMRPGKGSFIGPPDDPQKYHVLQQIGEGATATVHRCMCGDDIFAVKSIKLMGDVGRVKDKLHKEVNILLSLRHPRIVSLYDVMEEENKNLHLVMEYVDGGDLFEQIVEGAFSEQKARYVFLQVADVLKYIHSQNIIHRDIKPENILVDAKKSRQNYLEVKLSDFGHSKIVADGYTVLKTRCGTEQYWAPEIEEIGRSHVADRTQAMYDESVDVWSLGIVLYVMLVGTYPFKTRHGRISVDQIFDEERNPQLQLKCLSTASKELIGELVKTDPKKRLSVDKCCCHPWVRSPDGPMSQVMNAMPEVDEIRITLPVILGKGQRDCLQSDLMQWTKRFNLPVIVTKDIESNKTSVVSKRFAGPPAGTIREEAENELRELVKYNCTKESMQPSNSVGAHSSAITEPRPESCSSFNVFSTQLRVNAASGAGMVLLPERGGMRVMGIEDVPGQPNLQKNDLITHINNQPLRGEHNVKIFGTNFKDSVEIQIKRET